MLYIFIAFLVIAVIVALLRTLYVSIYFLIITGAIIWLYALFLLEAQWQYQAFGIALVVIGIFLAHIWEEMFQEKKGKSTDL